MKIKDLSDGSIYDMPDKPAILRAIRGEVKILENPAMPIDTSIQEAIDDLRSKIQTVPREMLEKIEARKDPETWKACIDALKPLVIKLFRQGHNYISMEMIREEAEKDPFLRRFKNSIGQRVRDLKRQGFLEHYRQDGKPVVGHYVLSVKSN